MSGFSEDERIRHKNEKFADAFADSNAPKFKNGFTINLQDISIAYFVEVMREKGLKVTLEEGDVMVVTADSRK